MNSEIIAYITLICMSGVLNLYLGLNVFLKRHHYTNIAYVFVLYMLSITVYCFASAFALLSTTIEQVKFWTVILYIGMPISVPLGLLFIMHYLGMKMTKVRYFLLMIVPFTSLFMVVTNDWHHLHYRVFEIDPILGIPYIHQEPGLWYIVHGAYIFGCMFVALLLAMSRWKETAKAYRPQLISLMFGQFIPMATAFLYLLGLTPPGFDPVPMVLWVTSLLYLWSINTSRMFTITPVAKDAIFQSINDGVMVLDESLRLIEFNQACTNMLPGLEKTMFGKHIEKIWLELMGVVPPFTLEKGEMDSQNQEIRLVDNEQVNKVYQVRTTTVDHSGQVQGKLLIFTDITEVKHLQVKLEHMAYYDELTQIYNRRAFFNKCELDYVEATERFQPFSVILMDIDYFKRVNDTYGHHIGDKVLVHAVKVCQAQLKGDEIFARYGGEEFVVALKGCTLVEAEQVANVLRTSLESQPLFTPKGLIHVTLSLGVSESNGTEEETLYQLLNKADNALYMAKQNGRNRVHVYAK